MEQKKTVIEFLPPLINYQLVAVARPSKLTDPLN
jgi:hypothetical protein